MFFNITEYGDYINIKCNNSNAENNWFFYNSYIKQRAKATAKVFRIIEQPLTAFIEECTHKRHTNFKNKFDFAKFMNKSDFTKEELEKLRQIYDIYMREYDHRYSLLQSEEEMATA
jgi:hypothetical protein